MTNGLELAQRAVALWRQEHGDESLYLQCQRASWYFQWAYQGNEDIYSYGTAIAAARSSIIFTTDPNHPAIIAGDELFWDVGSDGHVVTVVGRDAGGRVLVANTARSGDNFQNLGNHLFICHADSFPNSWGFIGTSHANGRNIQKAGITNWPSQALAGNERRVTPGGPANGRADAFRGAEWKQEIPGDDTGTFDGWKNGESISGNSVWIRGAIKKNWFWSGSFTDTGTHDFADLNPVIVVPPVVTPPVTPPVVLPPAREPALVQPKASDFPAWIQFDVRRNPKDNRAAINAEGRAYYAAKGQTDDYYPVKHIAHWWGAPGAYSHDGVINTMTGQVDFSVHFITSAGRVTEVQPLNLLAYTSGNESMHSWSTENDPLLTEQGYKTLGFLTYLVEKLNPRLLDERIELHKDQVNIATGKKMETACSNIDTTKVRRYATAFRIGQLDVATGEMPPIAPPVVDPPVVTPPVVDPPVVTPPVVSSGKWGLIIAAAVVFLTTVLGVLQSIAP